MTTLAQARAALVTAVGAAEGPIDPPATYVFSEGTDFERLGGTGIEWSWRVTCAVGYPGDDGTASRLLAAHVITTLAVLYPLAGWRVLRVSGDQMRTISGGEQLTADIIVSTKVDI